MTEPRESNAEHRARRGAVMKWFGRAVALTLAIGVAASLIAMWIARDKASASLVWDSTTIISPRAPGIHELSIVFGEEPVLAAYTVAYTLRNDGNTFIEPHHFDPPFMVSGPEGACRIASASAQSSRDTLRPQVVSVGDHGVMLTPIGMEPGDYIILRFALLSTVPENVATITPGDVYRVDPDTHEPEVIQACTPETLAVDGHIRHIGDCAEIARTWDSAPDELSRVMDEMESRSKMVHVLIESS